MLSLDDFCIIVFPPNLKVTVTDYYTKIILIHLFNTIPLKSKRSNTLQPQCLCAKIPKGKGSHCHSKISFSKNIINIHITPGE